MSGTRHEGRAIAMSQPKTPSVPELERMRRGLTFLRSLMSMLAAGGSGIFLAMLVFTPDLRSTTNAILTLIPTLLGFAIWATVLMMNPPRVRDQRRFEEAYVLAIALLSVGWLSYLTALQFAANKPVPYGTGNWWGVLTGAAVLGLLGVYLRYVLTSAIGRLDARIADLKRPARLDDRRLVGRRRRRASMPESVGVPHRLGSRRIGARRPT